MRVLMATDGSSRATATLIAAGRMLAPANRRVDLVTVVPRVPDHTHHSHRERLNRRAQVVADRTKAEFAAEGISVDASIRTGSPARILIGASYNYDVTILAAASRRSVPMVGLGPVASRVAEHARGAVLLAREGRGESGLRVLAPVDGSEGSLRALDLLAELVDLKEAEITLLHVIETPWLHSGPDQEWLGYEEGTERIDTDAQLQEVFVKEGDDILLAAAQRLPSGTSTSVLTREGLPGDEILSEVESGGYDLVVVGASGSLDMKHKILGSVSAKVAWNAPCSVLLVGPASEVPA